MKKLSIAFLATGLVLASSAAVSAQSYGWGGASSAPVCKSYILNSCSQQASTSGSGCALGSYANASDTGTTFQWTCSLGNSTVTCSAPRSSSCGSGSSSSSSSSNNNSSSSSSSNNNDPEIRITDPYSCEDKSVTGNVDADSMSGITVSVTFTSATNSYTYSPNVSSDGDYRVNTSNIADWTYTVSYSVALNGVTQDSGSYTRDIMASCSEMVEPQSCTDNTIQSLVYHDANENGSQDSGEPLLPGSTVLLLDANGSVVDSAVSNEFGFFYFENIASGSYTVSLATSSLPSGMVAVSAASQTVSVDCNDSRTVVFGANGESNNLNVLPATGYTGFSGFIKKVTNQTPVFILPATGTSLKKNG